MSKLSQLKQFDPEGELSPEKMQKNVEDYIVDVFSALPIDSQKRVLGELFELTRPEKPERSINKSYFNY